MGKYLIILHGSVPPTVEGQEQLRVRLINELGCQPNVVEAIFNSLPAILQNSLEASEAEEYIKVLQAFGGDVEMLEANETGEFSGQGQGNEPLLGNLGLSQFESSIASAGDGLLSLNSEASAMTDAFEVGTVEDSVSDLLSVLDHELEEPTENDEALLDLGLGEAGSASANPGTEAGKAEPVDDLGLGLWSESDALNFSQGPESQPSETPSAEPASLAGAEEFADLEAELMEALSFGEAEEESQDTSPPAQTEQTPIDDEPLGFSLDSSDNAAPVVPAAQTKAVQAPAEEEPAIFSFDDLDQVEAVAQTPNLDTAPSDTAFFEEEAGASGEIGLAPAAPDSNSDVDPLEARMQAPPPAPAAVKPAPVTPAAPAEDNFQWPDDPAADKNSGAASFAAKHMGGGASAAAAAAQAEVVAAKQPPNRQKLLLAIAAVALLALGGVSLYQWISRPTGFALNPESIDEMLKAQERMNKALDKQAAAEAPVQRTWVGTAETAELNIRLEVTTVVDKLVDWHIVVTSPEPPPLTEEEFGSGVERPWMKRAEADGAYEVEAAPSGTTVGFEGPGRAYIQHMGGTARLSVIAQAQVQRDGDEKLNAFVKIESAQSEDIALGKDGNGKLVVKRGADRRFLVKLTGEVPLIPGVSAKPKDPANKAVKGSTKKKQTKKKPADEETEPEEE